MIKHEDGKWTLYSHEGKSLGSYDSKEECEERERQVQAFKHMKEAEEPPEETIHIKDGHLLEALEPSGKTWRVRVLRFGRSMNGWLWTPEAGQALVGHLEGAPVGLYAYPGGAAHADEASVHLAKGPVVRNIVGDLSHPAVEGDGVYADLHLHEDVPWLKTKLLGLAQRGMLGKVLGLSVDTLASYAPVQLKEGAARAIKGITRLISLDIVGSPSADGRFVAVKEAEMKSDQLVTLVREHRPALLDGKDPTTLTEDDLTALVREALTTPPTPPPAPPAPSAPSNGTDPMAAMLARANQLNEEFALRVSSLRVQETIGRSGLPDYAQARLKQRFHGRIVEEDELDREIKGEREYLAKVSESGEPKGFGASKIEITASQVDKIQAACDAMLGIKEEPFMRALEANGPFSENALDRVRESFKGHREAAKDPGLRFKGLRHFYQFMTGDEDVQRLHATRGNGRVSEAVLSTTWGDVLGNTLYRTLLATYAEVQYNERTIASFGRAVDFRTRETVLLGYFADLANVAENGAYVAITDPGDDKVSYAVAKKGNLFEITMETIKNDDMRVVAESIRRLGRAARRTLAAYIWTMWNGAGVVWDVDTVAWFNAAHGNTGTTALTADMAGADAVWAQITQMANMVENPPTGNTGVKLGYPPTESLWLDVPIALGAIARKLTTAPEFGAGNTNPIFGIFGNPMRDPQGATRVNINPLFGDATDWGVHINPNTGGRSSIQVDFLDGNEEPEMFLADNPTTGTLFTHDRLQYKIRHIYGGDLLDFRGACKNVVA